MSTVKIANLGSNITPIQDVAVGTWTTVTSDLPSQNWFSVTWSPELSIFCAVGSGSTDRVVTSTDGLIWETRTPGEANSWNSVTWSPQLNLFCAVATTGTNRVMTSSDGSSWIAYAATEASSWTSVTWSPELGIFCAVSSNGTNRVMTSTNGSSWSTQSAAAASSWEEIVWSPELSIFCVVSSSSSNNIMTSSNGINWVTRVSGTASAMVSITWAPELSLFCAVGGGGAGLVNTSPDGINWTTRTNPDPSTNIWEGISWSPQLSIFSVVSDDEVMTSTDGGVLDAWVTRTFVTIESPQVTWSPEKQIFCATGINSPSVISDSDFSAYSTSTVIGTQGVSTITVAAQDLVIGKGSNTVTMGEYSSTTTVTGTNVTIGSAGSNVCLDGPLNLATSQLSDVQNTAVSTWTTSSNLTADSWNDVTWSREKSLLVAVGSGSTNRVATSTDGSTWTTTTSGTSSWSAVNYSPELAQFTAAASDGPMMTSPDGTNWSSSNDITTNWFGNLISGHDDFRSVAYSESLGIFVTVGPDASVVSSICVQYSSDGLEWHNTSWTTEDTARSWSDVIWAPEYTGAGANVNGGVFVTVSDINAATNRIGYSSDGRNWILNSNIPQNRQ